MQVLLLFVIAAISAVAAKPVFGDIEFLFIVNQNANLGDCCSCSGPSSGSSTGSSSPSSSSSSSSSSPSSSSSSSSSSPSSSSSSSSSSPSSSSG